MGSLLSSTNEKTPEFLTEILKSNKLVLFSKTYCPFCKNAKKVLENTGYKFKIVELDTHAKGNIILKHISKLSGIKTVPQLFLEGKFIGDSSKVKELDDDGKLAAMFNEHHVPSGTSTKTGKS